MYKEYSEIKHLLYKYQIELGENYDKFIRDLAAILKI